jgi:hypothetical protein
MLQLELGNELGQKFHFQVGKEMDCNSISAVWMYMEFLQGITG